MAQGQAAVSDPAGNIVTANGTSLVQLWQEWLLVCGRPFLKKTNQEIRELIVKASDRFSAPIINMAMVFLILLWLFVINCSRIK
jgi:hypothetical protein